MNNYHVSVLLQEVIEYLNVTKGEKYIDATLGGGGHAIEIVKRGGIVLGFDADQEAIDFVLESHKSLITGHKLTVVRGNFKDIKKIASEYGFNNVAGVIFDLGVSSHQFDSGWRGFSFRKEGPLDMRMDSDLKVQAKDLVNILTKGELYELFSKLGEERFSRSIANSIIRARRIRPFTSTTQLSDIISGAVPFDKLRLDAIARIYQALRIAINDELNNLREALPQAFELLAKSGKIAVISFHSLEDRIVKNQFLQWQDEGKGSILTKKPIRPSEEEIEKNKRSRSAKLRVIQKN